MYNRNRPLQTIETKVFVNPISTRTPTIRLLIAHPVLHFHFFFPTIPLLSSYKRTTFPAASYKSTTSSNPAPFSSPSTTICQNPIRPPTTQITLRAPSTPSSPAPTFSLLSFSRSYIPTTFHPSLQSACQRGCQAHFRSVGA